MAVVATIAAVVVILRAIALAFKFAPAAGLLALALVAFALYRTALTWVSWLPGLLFFGAINSLIAFTSHRAPTNPQVAVSTGVATAMLLFYVIGTLITYYYDPENLPVWFCRHFSYATT